jgi:ribonuclease PH
MNIVNDIVVRLDGRVENQTRALHAEIGVIKEAVGSSRLRQGSCEVLSIVYGPSQPKFAGKFEFWDRAALEVDYEELGSKLSIRERKDVKFFLQETISTCIDLAKYPRMLILVRVVVVQNDGSVLSCAFNSAIIALMDSGVSMKSTPFSSSFCYNFRTSILHIDPTQREESPKDGNSKLIIIASEVSEIDGKIQGKILSTRITGRISDFALSSALLSSMAAALQIKASISVIFGANLS